MTAFFYLLRKGRLGKLKSWFCTWWNNLNCFLTIIGLNLWLSHTFHCKMEQYVQESLSLYQSRCEKAILDNQLLFQCLNPDLFACLWLIYENNSTPIHRQWKSYRKSGYLNTSFRHMQHGGRYQSQCESRKEAGNYFKNISPIVNEQEAF